MDAKKATDVAREYVRSAFDDAEIAQLGLEEVEQVQNTKEWRITYGFVRPWELQAQQDVSPPRTYKVVIVDKEGTVRGITRRVPCPPKSVSAGRSRSSACTPGSWRYGVRSLRQALIVIPGSAVGLATVALDVFQVVTGIPTIGEAAMRGARFVGVGLGLVIVGLQYLRHNKGRALRPRKHRRWSLVRRKRNASSGRPRHCKRIR